MGWALEQPIAPVPKLVLVAICDVISDQPGHEAMYGGQNWLAEKLDMGERSIRRHLDTLERDGWIRREKRKMQGGEYQTDLVFVNHQRPEVADGQKCHSPAATNGHDQRPEVAAKTINKPLDRPLERRAPNLGFEDCSTEDALSIIEDLKTEFGVDIPAETIWELFKANALAKRKMIINLTAELRMWVARETTFKARAGGGSKPDWVVEQENQQAKIKEWLNG